MDRASFSCGSRILSGDGFYYQPIVELTVPLSPTVATVGEGARPSPVPRIKNYHGEKG